MSDEEAKPEPIIIKKYANRRLYNTGSSSYITLDHLGEMTRKGIDFKVVDAKTGEDITRPVLTQIIMDEENRGQTMLPTPFLRQLIAMYGDSMQSMVPPYLEASMTALRRNQEQFRKSMAGAFNPFETIAKQNMAMFEAAASMMAGKTPPTGEEPADTPADKPTGKPADEAAELADLKREMAELQAKLDRLGKA